ncbi:thioredoxin family protein [Streptococcus didelphis]|uniref:thioredoxin family protein n=1 Tax=Streptococcus didelphis TaxID=102886 RepID=UPI0027D21DD7|nr:thioredoxin family protein [Streptococcus didelphis]WMB29247.1 thioredoxin family protein [Streptococcus didelphis]
MFIIFAFYLLIFSGKINSSPKAASNSSQKIVATSAYDNAIKRMTAVSHKTVLQLVSRDKFTLLYMGRKSCPHCQQFMTVFEPSLKKTKKQVYYLNSEKMSDSLYRFADKYKIEEIPQLMAFRKGHLIETFEGKPDEKSILAFLDNYSDSE